MLSNVDICFHPSRWHELAGVEFDERFFFDAPWRVERDRDMRRALYEHFGEYGLGDKDPQPRGILFSDLIASGFLYSMLLGCEVTFSKSDAPQVICADIDDEAASALKAPDLSESPIWRDIESQINYLYSRFGRIENAINLQGIQNIALDLRGQQLFYDYYDDEDIARNLLEAATRLSLDIGKKLYAVSETVSSGVTPIVKQTLPEVYLTSNCSVTMISNDMYEKYLLEYDTRLANEFPCFGIHHCGANTENVIEGYLKVPNLKFLEIGAGSRLNLVAEALKRNNRNDIINCIRFSPVKLKGAKPDDISAHIREALEAFGSFDRLCFACVGIDCSVSDGDIKTYLSAFRG